MVHEKQIQEHVKARWVEDFVVCDICNKKITQGRWEASQVTIEARLGECYPEWDCRDGYKQDVCAKCFVEKVLPALKALGHVQHTGNIEDPYDTVR